MNNAAFKWVLKARIDVTYLAAPHEVSKDDLTDPESVCPRTEHGRTPVELCGICY
jgi:hypothetical protein